MDPELQNETEEREELGTVRHKVEHFKISRRDTLVNDLKNSTAEGLVSMGLSVVALLLVIASVLVSYYQKGNSKVMIGLVPLFALIISIAAIVCAGLGFKRKDKVRHYMEKRGLVIALITIAILIAIFIQGLQKIL